jgi:hypothetical protein
MDRTLLHCSKIQSPSIAGGGGAEAPQLIGTHIAGAAMSFAATADLAESIVGVVDHSVGPTVSSVQTSRLTQWHVPAVQIRDSEFNRRGNHAEF